MYHVLRTLSIFRRHRLYIYKSVDKYCKILCQQLGPVESRRAGEGHMGMNMCEKRTNCAASGCRAARRARPPARHAASLLFGEHHSLTLKIIIIQLTFQ